MDLGLSESQQMLKTSAREFLAQECPPALVRAMESDERGYTFELWQKMVEVGWLGLVFPEGFGGIGGDFLDLTVLLEEMGRAMVPGPYFSTVVLGGLPIFTFGSHAQKKKYLPAIARGQAIVTTALTEPAATYDAHGVQLGATHGDSDYALNGMKLFVPDAHVADAILVPARTASGDGPELGVTVFIVPANAPGMSATLLPTVARDKQCEMSLQNVDVGEDAVLGQVNEGWAVAERIREWAAVGACALMVGNADAALEMTLAYVKERTQFGRPIGSFQAIQHYCADMATGIEGARYVTYQAACKLAQGEPVDMEVSIAKAWVSGVSQRVAALAHQSHGAIGFTQEHDLSLRTRRAKAWEVLYGDGDFHRELIAQQLGL